jgi:ATP-binding protein involved in chromosome partitioning
MFEKVNVPVLGIIENMSYFICSHCGQREEIFANGGGRKAADDLGVPFLGEIPIYTAIRVSGDKGIPVAAETGTEQSEIMSRIARAMAAQVSIRNAEGSAPNVEIALGPS